MKKYYVISNSEAKLGYQLKVVNEDGSEELQDVKKVVESKGALWVILPKNELERDCCSVKAIEKAGGCYELIYKEHRAPGSLKKTEGASKEPKLPKVAEYLNDEEKAEIKAIYAKAQNRAKMAALKAEIERLTKQLNEMSE